MGVFVADLESTTKENDCRVWAYAVCDIEDIDNVKIGTTMDEFIKWCSIKGENHKIFFHNLKWDGDFIVSWLLRNGYKHTSDPYDRGSKTFNTLISSEGLYYQIEVIFYMKGKNINKVVFQDSMKLLPSMSVESVAEGFGMKMKKGSIDYSAHNDLPEGAPLTPEEEEYIKHDVQIIATAIKFFYDNGYTRMTIGSNALEEYKKSIGRTRFKRLFPTLNPKCFKDIKQSYKGGYCIVNPDIVGQTVGGGFVLDVNSLYPDRMNECLLPYGQPLFFRGEYRPDKIYPLFTQMIRCSFRLKEGKLPTIQIKYGFGYQGTQYLTTSNGNEEVLCLNSIDLKLFLEHYHVFNIEYIAGWKYKGRKGLFKDYITKWNDIKIEAKRNNNKEMYLLAKLFLNALYGKFGTNIKYRRKEPYLNAEGVVNYTDADPEYREGVYLPLASFVTSYAREKTIKAAQRIIDDYRAGVSDIMFLYADTDSLHILSEGGELPAFLEIDQDKLGAWKIESRFTQAKFLRAKCYMEMSTEDVFNPEAEYAPKITVAGMPKECKEHVTFENFNIGASYPGRLVQRHVKGGSILKELNFTIQP